MAEVHKQAMDLICTAIKNLDVSGFKDEEIVVRRWPWRVKENGDVDYYRGVSIHPEKEIESQGTNERDDIGYGIGVTCIMAADHSGKANIDRITNFRHDVRAEFHNQKLSGSLTLTGGVHLICKVEHNELNIPRGQHMYEISSQVIRFWMREARG